MNRPAKQRVRHAFERAAASYDSAAEIQRQICDRLLAGLPTEGAVHCLLDAGCGTGYALPRLAERFPDAERLALDFSPAMLRRTCAAARIGGDLEQLPLPPACLDLYWSSLAVQWCDLGCVLAEARRALKPTGQLALATLGTETFHELRHAFAEVDRHLHTIGFLPTAEITEQARLAGFRTVNLARRTEIAHYPDLRTLLRAVKAVGANQLGSGRRTALLGRSAFQRAEQAMESLRTPAGLPLTYDVIYLYAQP